jgi:hypothetical protein
MISVIFIDGKEYSYINKSLNNVNNIKKNSKEPELQAWQHTPVFLAFGRLRQVDCEFKASLGYRVRHCQINKQTNVQRSLGRDRWIQNSIHWSTNLWKYFMRDNRRYIKKILNTTDRALSYSKGKRR